MSDEDEEEENNVEEGGKFLGASKKGIDFKIC